MARLTKEEKQSLLAMAHSRALRRDFEAMREKRALLLKKRSPNLDEYIEFVTFVNAFANHAPKPFVKMEGDNFRM